MDYSPYVVQFQALLEEARAFWTDVSNKNGKWHEKRPKLYVQVWCHIDGNHKVVMDDSIYTREEATNDIIVVADKVAATEQKMFIDRDGMRMAVYVEAPEKDEEEYVNYFQDAMEELYEAKTAAGKIYRSGGADIEAHIDNAIAALVEVAEVHEIEYEIKE